ncbi:MAG: hypothetical protein JSR21_12140 [Proteobacteria bacterium]|nr:hypothetical protein [Pseudomonadota bacterium]
MRRASIVPEDLDRGPIRCEYDMGGAVRRIAVGGLLALSCALPALGAGVASGTCVNMDPSSVLAGVSGDFELTVDPDDPAAHVLFVSNLMANSFKPQNVVVAQIDGLTGQVVAGSLRTVARNFQGNSNNNGAEWIRTPQGQLGIIYPGANGVYGVFRSAPPSVWSDFLYGWDGAPAQGVPPVLPSSLPGYADALPPKPPQQEATIPMYSPIATQKTCSSACYGAYNAGVSTDVTPALLQRGLLVGGVTQTIWDSWLYVAACTTRTQICGIYQAQIDGNGGFGTVQSIATVTGIVPQPGGGLLQMVAVQHPVSGATLLFSGETPKQVSVWSHAAQGAPLTLLARVPVPAGAVHYRAYANDTVALLNFYVRSGAAMGQYTVTVSADGPSMTVGSATQISNHSPLTTELQWYPAAAKWAVSLQLTDGRYQRCWVTS